MLIQTKLQSTTFTYNSVFQNKMNHVLGVLRLEFTIPLFVLEFFFLHVLV
jgi:hypothetical protein